jgi:hypothetical protein
MDTANAISAAKDKAKIFTRMVFPQFEFLLPRVRKWRCWEATQRALNLQALTLCVASPMELGTCFSNRSLRSQQSARSGIAAIPRGENDQAKRILTTLEYEVK